MSESWIATSGSHEYNSLAAKTGLKKDEKGRYLDVGIRLHFISSSLPILSNAPSIINAP